MRGRKPSSPKVKDLAKGTLQVVGGGAGELRKTRAAVEEPPDWLNSEHARALWRQLCPQLLKRKQYIDLFAVELGRYCHAFGEFVECDEKVRAVGAVVKSPKGYPMMSPYLAMRNRAAEMMRMLAGDLGLNPVAQMRISGAQLDLFDAPMPAKTGTDGDNPFAGLRRR